MILWTPTPQRQTRQGKCSSYHPTQPPSTAIMKTTKFRECNSIPLDLLSEYRSGKMKKGSLQSKKQSLEAKQRKNSMHMRGRARICVLLKDLSTPRQLWPRLGIAPWLPLTTHRRGSPRICVESQQLTFQSHV
ncbi:hypothetical protein PIB30_050514 [Stylosanthes scabra]|uniref:Uncharacterized protein n=1 Tax=Stylosanthes scabra TaxID=79078 RepID=A0ABU6THE8_9FABA|nr:hypothetical protein [Stylosanthes scabra]